MNRRHFLKLTGAAATACVLPGCTRHRSGTQAAPIDAEWTAFARGLAGKLIRPGDTAYEAARVVYNARFDHVRPQAVVQCANADDVRETLRFVRQFGLAVTPRGGGHSYAGYSTGPGIVVDLAPMRSVTADGDTATIGAGAKLIDVYDQLTAKGVCIPAGSCPTVGIAGLTMGGGIGLLDRTYGLTADCLLGADVVTADGRLLRCDERQNADLFWALRGGGGGNFGIATSFTFRTHRTRELGFFFVKWNADHALDALRGWQAWGQRVSDDVWCGLSIWNEAHQFNLFAFGICSAGDAAMAPALKSLLSAVGKDPLFQQSGPVPYTLFPLEAAGCHEMTVAQCHLTGQTPEGKLERHTFAGSSDIFEHWLPDAGMEALVGAIRARYDKGLEGAAMLDLMGGAVNRVAPDATAFVHRKAAFTAQYFSHYAVGTADAIVDEAAAWETSMRARMRPWSSGHAYQNYLDPNIKDWKDAYYGANYPRLVKVKSAYDPDWVFRFDQGIPPR
jgi:FAD/FMN-containing dehydrogenase